MTTLTHLSIHLFPMSMLLILYFDNRKKGKLIKEKQIFNRLVLLTICIMAVDTFGWSLADWSWPVSPVLPWVVQIMEALLRVSVFGCWILYLCFRLYGEHRQKDIKAVSWILAVLFIVYAVVIAASPWTHLIFSIGPDRLYQREPFYWIPECVDIILLLAGAILVTAAGRRDTSRERRQECEFLRFFSVFSLVGILTDHFWEDWWIGIPCMSVSVLFVYINTQNQKITMDGLTGLNNRREFDRYLHKKIEQGSGQEWGILMMDVDDFKSINDRFGHAAGDRALCETADILRHAAQREPVFLARYGGDEFSVVGNWKNIEDAGGMMRRLNEEAEQYNKEGNKPYHLSLSIGCAMWSENESGSLEELIKKADERMYEHKMGKKEKKILENG